MAVKPNQNWPSSGSSVEMTLGSSSLDGEDEVTIWSRLLSRGGRDPDDSSGADSSCDDDDHDSFGEEDDCDGGRRGAGGGCSPSSAFFNELATSSSAVLSALRRHPRIPLGSLLVLAACLVLGLSFVSEEAAAHEAGMLRNAEFHAAEAMEWFSDGFDRALAPLFALAQVVKHDEELCGLARAIGSRGDPGAMPGWPVDVDPSGAGGEGGGVGASTSRRDVRGVCDDGALRRRFEGVAESVRRDSGLGGVISGLRVAPAGVICMIHPVIDYDDYAHVETNETTGIEPYYNGTKRLYNDWAWDKASHMDVLRKTLRVQEAKENRITVTGPFEMKSAGGDGTVLTETLFCTHLGVSVPNHTVTMMGEGGADDPPERYDSWGFVMGFVNWQYMVDRSRIDERFRDLDMVYMLNRTYERRDRAGGEAVRKTDRIAWTRERCVTSTEENARVTVSKAVNGDDWTLVAGYTCATRPPWERWANLAVVVTSAIISCLVLSTLVKNQQHKDLLFKMMPKRAIKKLNRGQTVIEKYSCVTIFFSDIVGFTSMAGEMRPIEVMSMLNALYVEFDKLCKKHDCYKVETIGDAYMVVGGVPDRCGRAAAAEKVASFALDALGCVESFRTPDGSSIGIRAGMASGPVVAGVVGDVMPRYCLFGDTVNYASRMESTSAQGKIQVCDRTGRLLSEASRGGFALEERRDDNGRTGTMVKGKGWRETWWLMGTNNKNDSKTCGTVPLELNIVSTHGEHHSNPDITAAPAMQNWAVLGQDLDHPQSGESERIERVISLLEYRLFGLVSSRTGSAITTREDLPMEVCQELRSIVFKISSLYNPVHFHNFDHACHVTISINELLDISASTRNQMKCPGWYWSNEMICFAMVFSALIHDVGHLGMTNKMLVDQGHCLAKKHKNKSVAESNSIDVAIDLLLNGDFSCLRAAVFQSQDEVEAFVMLVRVAVSATDIASKDNMDECKELLSCAFDINPDMNETERKELQEYHAFKILTANNLDASQFDSSFKIWLCRSCSLLQHLIQAADIAHSMQSFEISIRWNYRLFKELHACYSSHLLPADPGALWASGEVGFFGGYVQPLATRLRQISCLDSDEISVLSHFARENRDRWEEHGKHITEIMAKGIASGQEEEATIDSILHVCQSALEKRVTWVGGSATVPL